ncbi:ribonuclease E inhibitor RraB [Litorimonas sp. WD9-15]|uniref:ribonuclease E inhibitor RraB n=1 Tax=Litorimonas sp. WD9-15 TaxID=3418716 RepID=UPI003CFF037C
MSSLEPMDAETLKTIAGHGDDKSAIRDVIHYTYFEEEAEARSFARAVLAQGFHDVALGQPGLSDGDTGYVIRAHHDGTLIEGDISKRLSTIRQLAEKFSGDYDGWEAALVLKD